MAIELKVHSGECCQCDIGISTGKNDVNGAAIHTGDIVLLWSVAARGTDLESRRSHGLTAVVADQYQSYSDGTVKVVDAGLVFFVMGIKSCGFNDPSWEIEIVKKYSDVIQGERWPAYGLSYRHNDAAEAAKLEKPQ